MAAISSSDGARPAAARLSSISERRSSDNSSMTSPRCSFGSQNSTARRYRSSSSIVFSYNPRERRVERLPLPEQRREDRGPVRREPVEPLAALVFLAPLTHQETLALEPAQQRVERTLVDLQPLVGQRLAQGVAVAFGPQGGEDGD